MVKFFSRKKENTPVKDVAESDCFDRNKFLAEVDKIEYFYHGTNQLFLDNILEKGLDADLIGFKADFIRADKLLIKAGQPNGLSPWFREHNNQIALTTSKDKALGYAEKSPESWSFFKKYYSYAKGNGFGDLTRQEANELKNIYKEYESIFENGGPVMLELDAKCDQIRQDLEEYIREEGRYGFSTLEGIIDGARELRIKNKIKPEYINKIYLPTDKIPEKMRDVTAENIYSDLAAYNIKDLKK